MRSRRRGEKKIDNWTYSEAGVTVPIAVYMVRANKPGLSSGVKFSAHTESPALCIENANIDELRKLIFKHLKDTLAIKWSPVFHISVSQSNNYGDAIYASIVFSYEEFEIGRNSKGDQVYRKKNSNTIRQGALEEGSNIHYGREVTISIVAATPANRAALEDITSRFKKLRKLCEQFFAPDQAQATLDKAQKLLPLPKGDQ